MSASTVEASRRAACAEVADALLVARAAGPAADARRLAPLVASAHDAYEVQAIVARALQPAGAPALHWKSGAPSRQAGLTHAPLPAQGVWASPADATGHPFRLRLVEAEIALRLGTAVTPAQAAALTQGEAEALVDAMAVAIEIVDSRWDQGVDAPALLKLADYQSHGALVLGAWQPYGRRAWTEQACTVRIGRREPARFRGTHALQDPAWLLPLWLRHATAGGATVPAGSVVTTGTWCGMLPASAGDAVEVSFEGVGHAFVQL